MVKFLDMGEKVEVVMPCVLARKDLPRQADELALIQGMKGPYALDRGHTVLMPYITLYQGHHKAQKSNAQSRTSLY